MADEVFIELAASQTAKKKVSHVYDHVIRAMLKKFFGIYGQRRSTSEQRRSTSDCAFAQSDLGLLFQLTESLNTVEYIIRNGQERS